MDQGGRNGLAQQKLRRWEEGETVRVTMHRELQRVDPVLNGIAQRVMQIMFK